MNDLALYAVHVAFWASFGITRRVLRSLDREAPASEQAHEQKTAPFSRALLGFHMLAFGTMYFGIANAVIPARVPEWFAGQRIAGSLVIAAGASLMCWSLIHFRSWRFRAQLEKGHQLATQGPFAWLRHPIYMGLNLLALGTALWVPSVLCWAALALMIVGSDLRGRSEEKLLLGTFGAAYEAYAARTRRFVPGIY